ncbi:hypothetical protein ONE63_005054 [Megalurothrips usitatus]|uniref:Farnesol dehydrogenase-like n=1 Tax=Megalurothrips usitatus TaxID=439358 RepID=A0AAV7X855_9NEOP|nr:hypothetical protein ONE63_005054 [Megalurothrips usitatus]
MDRFSGRVAVVTGASSGIGAEIAQDLVRAGLLVVGVARRVERVQALADSLQSAKGKLHPLQADLSVIEEVQRVYQWVEDNLGGVSILVNNAAILTQDATQCVDPLLVQKLVSTNLTCVMISSQEAIKSMQKHDIKDGHIVNINSIAGHAVINPPGQTMSVTAYTSSKYGITAFSKGLRYDLQKIPGFKIRVTSLSPGAVATEMLPEEFVKKLPDHSTVLQANDVSSAVVYALSCPPGVEITELTIQPTGEAY